MLKSSVAMLSRLRTLTVVRVNSLASRQVFRGFGTALVLSSRHSVTLFAGNPRGNESEEEEEEGGGLKAEGAGSSNRGLKLLGAVALTLGLVSLVRRRFGCRARGQQCCTEEEVAAKRGWAIYAGAVYDLGKYKLNDDKAVIAQAIDKGVLEAFWQKLPSQESSEIISELEKTRIGRLVASERIKQFGRYKKMKRVDPASYELEISLGESSGKKLKLDELKRLPKYSLLRSLHCRGAEHLEPARKLTAVKLSDILSELGVKLEDYDEVRFECLDSDKSGAPYATSLSLSKLSPDDILLAYELDDPELPLKHGFPLRVVMPELGAKSRSVKWLKRIVLKNGKVTPS